MQHTDDGNRGSRRGRGTVMVSLALVAAASCANGPTEHDDPTTVQGAAPAPLAPQLDPTTIPRFAHDMPRLFTYEPTIVRNGAGQVIRRDYTISIAKFTEQQLPPSFPATLLFGYGSNVRI